MYELRSAFVGGPFMQAVQSGDGLLRADVRERLQRVITFLEGRNMKVFSAHRREAWGAEMLPADQCTAADYTALRSSDLFVAFPGAPASPGTHIEIGWATAWGVPVVLVLEDDLSTYAFLVQGLPSVAQVSFVQYTSADDFLSRLDRAIASAIGSTPLPH